MSKCPHCKRLAYPWFDEQKKPIWKNIFKIDWGHMFIIFSIILIVVGYNHDIKQCDEVIEDPCGFCERSNCCIILAEQEEWQPIQSIPTLNDSMYIE